MNKKFQTVAAEVAATPCGIGRRTLKERVDNNKGLLNICHECVPLLIWTSSSH
jgi:hypothetical protein